MHRPKPLTSQDLARIFRFVPEALIDSVVARHHAVIMRAIRRKLSNPDDIDEAYNDTLRRINRSGRTYDPCRSDLGTLLGWIKTLARRSACRCVRRIYKDRDLRAALEQNPDRDCSDESLRRIDNLDELAVLMARHPEIDQALLFTHNIDALAKSRNVTRQSLYNRKNRALESLRRCGNQRKSS